MEGYTFLSQGNTLILRQSTFSSSLKGHAYNAREERSRAVKKHTKYSVSHGPLSLRNGCHCTFLYILTLLHNIKMFLMESPKSMISAKLGLQILYGKSLTVQSGIKRLISINTLPNFSYFQVKKKAGITTQVASANLTD